jgi:hypothetical protein
MCCVPPDTAAGRRGARRHGVEEVAGRVEVLLVVRQVVRRDPRHGPPAHVVVVAIVPVFVFEQVRRFGVCVGDDVDGCWPERGVLDAEFGNGFGNVGGFPPHVVPGRVSWVVGKAGMLAHHSPVLVLYHLSCMILMAALASSA